ncbi:MAG: LysR family transcriptional regulator [Roseibium sp.]|uniref:LysR family transcriptional regulator n=1 Tax=Roseibium sp. TaxID=1936156 RepID=UPI00261B2F28|nr:LysR family transcriptional regulator [Roseibium sp.]MCV0426921.1 LysR family transcriptional regulator [Roseibium sp.]
MNAQILEWADIPFVLAVCEEGSLSGAARKLGVNHSTVFRRIESVEARVGVKLFERLSHGYVMTVAGEHFFRNALILRDGLNGIQRELGGRDLRLEGPLRVTTTDSLLHRLSSVVAEFQQAYPEIELDLICDSRPLDLMQRDADVALRPTSHPPEHWLGRNLFPIAYATFAHRNYLEVIGELPAARHRWVTLSDTLQKTAMSRLTDLQKEREAPVTTTNTLMSVFNLVCSGLGLAVMPCYVSAFCADLVRLETASADYNSDLWLLAHPDMRRNAKVHAFFEFASTRIRASKADFI